MRLSLLRRDYAILMLFFTWGLGIAQGTLLGRAAGEDYLAGYTPEAVPPGKLFFTWFVVLTVQINFVLFMITRMREIASPFRITLPIPARDLWFTRMFAIEINVVGAALLQCLFYTLNYDPPLHQLHYTLAFNAISFIFLMPFLYRSVRVRSGGPGMPLMIYLPLLLGLIWTFTQIGVRTYIPGVVCMVAAVALCGMTWVRLPAGFELQPKRPLSLSFLEDAASFCIGWTERLPLLGSFVRMDRALRSGQWLSVPQLVLILSLTTGIGCLAFTGSPLALVACVVVIQYVLFARTINGGARVAHLPISRARVFHHAALPGLLGAAALAALLATLLPSLTFGQVFSSKAYALGVILYLLTWKFCLALLPAAMATPPRTARGWTWRHATNVHIWLALLLLVFVCAAELRNWTPGAVSGRPNLLLDLSEMLPLGSAALWALAGLVLVLSYVALLREVLRSEPVTATKVIES